MANTDTYTLLEPIINDGKTIEAVNTGATSYTYFKTVYNTALTLTIALAVLMIVIGGVQYTLSYIPAAKSGAKDRVWGAIGGLVLALVSYLILQTINPALLTPSFVPK
ncbi:MAG: hypothetical protein AAB590_03160 [Patescibacteria group bacterium]